MTAAEKLARYKDGWVRQLADSLLSFPRAENIVRLAELNGLFDPLKDFYSLQETAADDRYSNEAIGIRVRNELTI